MNDNGDHDDGDDGDRNDNDNDSKNDDHNDDNDTKMMKKGCENGLKTIRNSPKKMQNCSQNGPNDLNSFWRPNFNYFTFPIFLATDSSLNLWALSHTFMLLMRLCHENKPGF